MRARLNNDQRLIDAIVPKEFVVGCRRPTPGNGYLEALLEPNVQVFTEMFQKITEKGFIDADGKHLGGFICPGLPLMRNQLRTHTRKIRYDDASAERALERLSPGRTTVEAVERGCTLMLRGFVLTQIELARSYWGDSFTVFLTGGDADLVFDAVPQARLVPDLVFIGLAMACPLP